MDKEKRGMENPGATPPELGENHRRVIRLALIGLDRVLCRFEELSAGLEIRSEMFELRNTIAPAARKGMMDEIAALRRMITELREAFGFEKKVDETSHIIQTLCSVVWENMSELQSKHLRQYGEPPPGFGAYFDPKVEAFIERLDRISRLLNGA